MEKAKIDRTLDNVPYLWNLMFQLCQNALFLITSLLFDIQYWFISYLLIKFKHKYRENLKIFKNWFVRFCGAFAFGPQVQHISSATKLLSYDPKELQENPMLDVHPKRRTNGHGYQLLLHHSSQ